MSRKRSYKERNRKNKEYAKAFLVWKEEHGLKALPNNSQVYISNRRDGLKPLEQTINESGSCRNCMKQRADECPGNKGGMPCGFYDYAPMETDYAKALRLGI